MQRKLSEIAEIPKILSSTLATMSQTFDKLMPASSSPFEKRSGDDSNYDAVDIYDVGGGNGGNGDGRTSKQERKYSYDEDAIDYALSDEDDDEDDDDDDGGGGVDGNDGDEHLDGVDDNLNDEMNAQLQRLSIVLQKRAAERQQQEKDTTPESDYASEANYMENELDTDGGYDDNDEPEEEVEDDGDEEKAFDSEVTTLDEDDDEDENGEAESEDEKDRNRDMNGNVNVDGGGKKENKNEIEIEEECENVADDTIGGDDETVNKYNFIQKYIVTGNGSRKTAKTLPYKNGYDNGEDDKEVEDFLTTTFTWNLRNVPKLQITDEELQIRNCNNIDLKHTPVGVGFLNVGHQSPASFSPSLSPSPTPSPPQKQQQQQQIKRAHTPIPEDLDKQQQKSDKMCKYERCWPWADREKIIYKQSTCHLVPRHKPLGLVEQRKQLLVKQNLMQHLQNAEAPLLNK